MYGVIRIRLDFSYRGTDFAGWATQPGLRTVEGVLDDALTTVLRVPAPRVTVAGRTDSGVHSRGQVAHLDLDPQVWARVAGRPGEARRTPAQALLSRLNGVLPGDLRVRAVSEAPPGFEARFGALLRRYTFRIADAPELHDPLTRDWVLWTRRGLDVGAMHAALQPLLGVRDFAAFCRPRPGATTIRHLQEFSWERPSQGPDAGLVVARIQADAFCHNMVRALVGASLAVGEGRQDIDWPAQVLALGERDPRAGVIDAHGLVLEEVLYPPDAELALRAEQIRARRMDEHVWVPGEP
ncbi:tRNA pseudouridine synthase A [Sanguibacter gelidistatuariae]|nr:tRNA pseudouridine synthase A [Sanguibacter gelidistatuariae]